MLLGHVVNRKTEIQRWFPKLRRDSFRIISDSKDGVPTHAARQMTNGRWTSKLGAWEIIEHDFDALEGAEYGQIVEILRRRRRRS